ncbi:MAG: mechanosensitive ion channel [Burkholderiaceae bacterium]|nr:mechanosensitive ion channel [Burkholderiaceae bacterium]
MTAAHDLWPALLADLGDPGVLWQLLALVVCGTAGWLLSRALMKRFNAQQRAWHVALDSFQRVLTPLLTLCLLAIANQVLARWQNVALLRVAIPLTLSYLLIRVVFYLLRKAFARDGRVGGILMAFEQTFAIIVWSGLAIYITGLWPDFILYLEQTTLPIGRHRESLMVILQALLSVGATLVVALWAASLLEQRLMKLDGMHSSLRAVLARVGRAVLILIAVLISLSLVGIDLTVLSVFGGALGVGLGLGLQKLVSSYVSGFVVLLERSLAIGDVVSVDKYSGQIVKINTRYTVLKGGDGSESIIPNEMLVSLPVQNLCLTDRNARISCVFMVEHGVDLDALFAAIRPVVAEVPRVLAQPAPTAMLNRMAPDGLEIDVGFWIADPENGRAPVVSAVNLALLSLLRRHGLRLASTLPREPSVPDQTHKSLITKELSGNSA